MRIEILKLMKVLNLDYLDKTPLPIPGVILPHFFYKIFAGFFLNTPYQYQKYKYGHPYLTYLPQIFLSKLFFQKKFGWEVPYLPTVWTYVHTFVVFFFGTLS